MMETHYDEFKNNRISMQFVERDLTAEYPYSTVHYLLTYGTKEVTALLEGQRSKITASIAPSPTCV